MVLIKCLIAQSIATHRSIKITSLIFGLQNKNRSWPYTEKGKGIVVNTIEVPWLIYVSRSSNFSRQTPPKKKNHFDGQFKWLKLSEPSSYFISVIRIAGNSPVQKLFAKRLLALSRAKIVTVFCIHIWFFVYHFCIWNIVTEILFGNFETLQQWRDVLNPRIDFIFYCPWH